jgi:hypothetical protein
LEDGWEWNLLSLTSQLWQPLVVGQLVWYARHILVLYIRKGD